MLGVLLTSTQHVVVLHTSCAMYLWYYVSSYTHPRGAMNLEVSRYSGILSLLWLDVYSAIRLQEVSPLHPVYYLIPGTLYYDIAYS